jgi:hypothetical protein
MNALTAAFLLLTTLVLMRTNPKALMIILAVVLVMVVGISILKAYDFEVTVTRHIKPTPSGGWSQVEIAKPQTLQVNP